MKGFQALLERAVAGSRDARVYICERSFAVFAAYYFAEYISAYKIPAFQWTMYDALDRFTQGKVRFMLWVMFRESAKTTLTKIYVVYCIVYRKKRFINWDSYDKGNSEAALFDIATWLQTNKKIIADFGQLYFEDAKMRQQQALKKSISEFVTANRVKVKAYSTQESTRGRIFDKWRPDLYVVDDFETEATIKSLPVTAKIMAHIDALKAGISTDGQIVFLGNLITETGSVASLMTEAKENPKAWESAFVPVEVDGEIMWPGKYVATNEEAERINSVIPDRKLHVVSLEQKRKDLNAGGRKVYEAEMLNNPEAAGELFFDRERVDRDIARAKLKKPVKVVGGFSIWEEYQARNRFAIGADTAKGVSRDSCTSAAIRFSAVSDKAALVVGTYASNTIPPDLFGDELASHGRMFGECLLAPELNNTGYATVTRLKAIYPQSKIYRQVREDQVGDQKTKDLGWEATSANVSTIYYNFRSAYNAGLIEIYCPILLAEMRAFTKRHLEGAMKKGDVVELDVLRTRHFDLLRAVCIAWAMDVHAKPTEKKKYKQGDYVPRSDYQG